MLNEALPLDREGKRKRSGEYALLENYIFYQLFSSFSVPRQLKTPLNKRAQNTNSLYVEFFIVGTHACAVSLL